MEKKSVTVNRLLQEGYKEEFWLNRNRIRDDGMIMPGAQCFTELPSTETLPLVKARIIKFPPDAIIEVLEEGKYKGQYFLQSYNKRRSERREKRAETGPRPQSESEAEEPETTVPTKVHKISREFLEIWRNSRSE